MTLFQILIDLNTNFLIKKLFSYDPDNQFNIKLQKIFQNHHVI